MRSSTVRSTSAVAWWTAPSQARQTVTISRGPMPLGVAVSSKPLLLSVDGQEERQVRQGDHVRVRRSARSVRFIHLPGYSYFKVLRQKLNWRGSSGPA